LGSEAVASFVAHVSFWFLLAYGWLTRTLGLVPAAIFVALWMVGALGMPYLPYEPARAMFSSFVAVLDIALVFVIFKGDVRLT
jgi:hypothetical protein